MSAEKADGVIAPGLKGPRFGYVALLGPPNAGKSTLMNALIGERLSIVTPKPQTTWARVTGILTDDIAQVVFLDIPGVMEARDLLHHALLSTAETALRDADLVLIVLDGTDLPNQGELARLLEFREKSSTPSLLALNKIDRLGDQAVADTIRWAEERFASPVFPISAQEGTGVGELLEGLQERLPEGPFLYPADEIAAEPVRFFASELVRETVFEQFEQEIPYSVFCQVGEFREGEDRTYLQVTIFVERASQKGILIGEGGRSIRELGTAARKKLEHFLDVPVYLDLWVKVLPKWRRKRAELRRLGLPVPPDPKSPS